MCVEEYGIVDRVPFDSSSGVDSTNLQDDIADTSVRFQDSVIHDVEPTGG